MKKVLYFGLDPTRFHSDGEVTHFPLIEIEPLIEIQSAIEQLVCFSTCIFTSRQAVEILWSVLSDSQKAYFREATHLCIGKATQEILEKRGIKKIRTAKSEQAEGVVTLLEKCGRNESYFFPHSQNARGVIHQALFSKKCRFYTFPLYKPVFTKKEKIHWQEFDELIFTSPSTIEAFQQIYKENPPACSRALGPITQEVLDQTKRKSKQVPK